MLYNVQSRGACPARLCPPFSPVHPPVLCPPLRHLEEVPGKTGVTTCGTCASELNAKTKQDSISGQLRCIQKAGQAFFHAGSCAAVSASGQAASGGCNAMHPVKSMKDCSGKRYRSAVRWRNLDVFPRLGSSAQVFCSPAKCVTSSSTWCRAAQPAANFKKVPSGSAVLQSFSVRSAVVLSDAAGNANCQVLAPMAWRAVIASASCASVSKHAMYCCGEPESCGQKHRTCSAAKDSANHAQCVAVTIHPPMPTPWSSAIASAAAKHAKTPGRCSGLSLSCAKHCCIQRIAALLSLLRCTSERSGSAMRIHVPLRAAVLGRSSLHFIGASPAKMTLALMGSQRPGGCATTVALLSSASRKGCQKCG